MLYLNKNYTRDEQYKIRLGIFGHRDYVCYYHNQPDVRFKLVPASEFLSNVFLFVLQLRFFPQTILMDFHIILYLCHLASTHLIKFEWLCFLFHNVGCLSVSVAEIIVKSLVC